MYAQILKLPIRTSLFSLIPESFLFPIRKGHVTRLGELLVQFPLPPNLTCAVIKAAALDCEDLLLPIAAMLSVENIFIRPGRGAEAAQPSVLSRISARRDWLAHTALYFHLRFFFILTSFPFLLLAAVRGPQLPPYIHQAPLGFAAKAKAPSTCTKNGSIN